MTRQLSLAAAASTLALAALCLSAPAITRGGEAVGPAPVAAMAGIELPEPPLPSLLPR